MDGTYTVRLNQKSHNGKPAHGQSRAAAPTGRAPSPGTLCAPFGTRAQAKNDQQKENTTWKLERRKSKPA